MTLKENLQRKSRSALLLVHLTASRNDILASISSSSTLGGVRCLLTAGGSSELASTNWSWDGKVVSGVWGRTLPDMDVSSDCQRTHMSIQGSS